jgi:hypothetical protein
MLAPRCTLGEAHRLVGNNNLKAPIGIFCFNSFEGWSRDVSEDVARELRRRCDLQLRDVPASLQDFVERHEGKDRDIQFPLPMRLV